MLKRKSLLALAAGAALGLPCLAMSESFSLDPPEVADLSAPDASSETAADGPRADTDATAPSTYKIRRTPPVEAGIRMLPPITAYRPETSAAIFAGSPNGLTTAQQVTATLPVTENTSSAIFKVADTPAMVAPIDQILPADAVVPQAVQEMPRPGSWHNFTIRPATQLTANRSIQVAQQVPPVPRPRELAPAPTRVESVPETVAEPVGEVFAEPAPAVQQSPAQAPVAANGPVTDEWESGDHGYGPCSGCGYGPFRRHGPPVVCYRDRPFGWYVRNAIQPQVMHGIQDQMVLYHYDFLEGPHGDQLSSRGRQQLEKFSGFVDSHGLTVVIQPTDGRPELNAARQAHVMMQLSTLTDSVTENSVVVARPRAPGLRGAEAFEIDQNLILQTRARGLLQGGGGGVGGQGFGFDASGLESGIGVSQ